MTIKYYDVEMTPKLAAKRYMYDNGAMGCFNPFDPKETTCFGFKLENMPTEAEQEEFWVEFKELQLLVAEFLGV